MNRMRKIAAVLTSFTLAATMFSCSSPTIGSGSAVAVTIDNYEVSAGIFIYYTIVSYSDAQSLIAEESGDTSTTPTQEEVEDATIDGLDSTEWIQNKATQYCSDFVAVEKEFEKIGAELTEDEISDIDTMVESALENEIFTENGIGEDSIRAIAESSYKSDYIFDYYYGTEGEYGMSEDELKEYFDSNFARVKYVSMSYLDTDGNKLDESGKKEIRDMAYEYADQINAKSDDTDKLYEMNDVIDDYDAYVEEQEAEASEEEETEETTTTTTTVTTTSAEETTTTTTTTTDPHENEQILQKSTTTAASDDDESTETTTTETSSASEISAQNLNDYVFEELTEYNKAVVFDDEDNDAIYVIIRADLKERMTEDDLWTEDNITYLEQLNYSEDYDDYMKNISDSYTAERNNRAYRRYKPFKLTLETS